jgi:hypothetical protein
VRKHLNNAPCQIDSHPNRALSADGELTEEFKKAAGYVGPCANLYPTIRADYARYLRGKTLLQTLMRQLTRKARLAKYSYNALIEMAATTDGPFVTSIFEKVRGIFTQQLDEA